MQRTTSVIVISALAVLATACSSMRVRTDFDSAVDFGSYASMAAFEIPAKRHRGPEMSELVDRRIAAAIASELAGKGLHSTSPRDADLLVTFTTAVRRRVTVDHAGWYGYRGPHWHGGMVRVSSYPEGSLVIDIVDRRSRELVWRGVGEGAFTSMNPSDETVRTRVARILKSFPPQR